MSYANTAKLEKVINPNLTFAALHSAAPHGEFKALVTYAKNKPYPDYLTAVEFYAPNVLAARIPCDKIESANADSNVISIEIREHITSSRKK